jgi:hypothetical protein
MPTDQRVLAVVGAAEELAGLYLELASLNQRFREMCENSDLPTEPLAGHA